VHVEGGRLVLLAARSNGSSRKTPDNPDAEAANTHTKCRLEWEDNPSNPHRGVDSIAVTYDFLGVVYDRCQNWRIAAAKRMILTSSASATYDANGNKVWTPGPSGATENAPPPPENSDEAWSHGSPKNEGGKRPGTTKPPSPRRKTPAKDGRNCCK